jgi:hypothetical protein
LEGNLSSGGLFSRPFLTIGRQFAQRPASSITGAKAVKTALRAAFAGAAAEWHGPCRKHRSFNGVLRSNKFNASPRGRQKIPNPLKIFKLN